MKTTFTILAALFLIACTTMYAEEQNGLSVNVSRKTLDINTVSGDSTGESTKRKQSLAVSVKNGALKPLLPGELHWTILVKKSSSYSLKYKGVEPLKALRPLEMVELTIGNFGVTSTRSLDGVSKDKIDYRLVITQKEKEVFRFVTDPDFESRAKEATLVDPAEKEAAAKLAAAEVAKNVPEPKLEADPGRLSVNIARKTLETSAVEKDPNIEGAITRQKQTLKLDIKNIGLKPLNSGEVRWTVLVKKRAAEIDKYEGVEPLKPLRPTEQLDVSVGEFSVTSVRSSTAITKNDIEYQVVVVHTGKETFRTATTAEFPALAKNATPVDRNGKLILADAPKQVAGADPKMPPTPPKPSAPAPPAAPPKPEPVVPRPPVDFFNLGGK